MKNDIIKNTLLIILYMLSIYIIAFILYPIKYDLKDLYQEGKSINIMLHHIGGVILSYYNFLIIIINFFILFTVIYWKKSFQETIKSPLFLILNISFLSHAYIEPGWLIVGDSNAHVARVMHLYQSYKENLFPGWSNFFYTGTPVLSFYAPLFFYISGIFTYIFEDVYLAIKSVLFISNILSALGMFYFLRALNLPKMSVLIGALIYGGSFAHIHLILFRGMFPQALIFLFLPWVFYVVERGCHFQGKKYYIMSLLAGLIFSGMLLSHIVTAAYSFLLLTIFMFCTKEKCDFKKWVLFLSLTGGIAVLLSSHAVLPVFLEKEGLLMAHLPVKISFEMPSLSDLSFLLRFRSGLSGEGSITFLGYIPIILSLISIVTLLCKQYNRHVFAVFLLIAICFFLKVIYVREGMFILFSISLLSAYGIKILMHTPYIKSYRSILILLGVELVIGSIYPLARTDKLFYKEIAHEIIAQFPHQRVVIAEYNGTNYNVPIGPNGGILGMYDIQKLDGPHNMTAPITHNYTVTVLRMVGHDLNNKQRISYKTKQLLCLYNVAVIAVIHPKDKDYDVIKTGCASPAFFAPQIIQSQNKQELSDYPAIWSSDQDEHQTVMLATEALSEFQNKFLQELRYLKNIPVRYIDPSSEFNMPIDVSVPKDFSFIVKAYIVRRNTIYAEFFSNHDGFIRLSHPVFHGLDVIHNGQKVKPMQDVLGMMVLPIQKGDVTIQIEARKSTLREILSFVSMAVFIIICAILIILIQSLRRSNSKCL